MDFPKTFNLRKSTRARIWIGSLPDARYSFKEVASHSFQLSSHAIGSNSVACVELSIPTPGMGTRYALLGGTLTSAETGELSVAIGVSGLKNKVFQSPLTPYGECTHAGMPVEYVDGILNGFNSTLNQASPPFSGALLINCAAHDDVTSSNLMFRNAASILLKILCLNCKDPSDERLMAQFPSEDSWENYDRKWNTRFKNTKVEN